MKKLILILLLLFPNITFASQIPNISGNWIYSNNGLVWNLNIENTEDEKEFHLNFHITGRDFGIVTIKADARQISLENGWHKFAILSSEICGIENFIRTCGTQGNLRSIVYYQLNNEENQLKTKILTPSGERIIIYSRVIE